MKKLLLMNKENLNLRKHRVGIISFFSMTTSTLNWYILCLQKKNKQTNKKYIYILQKFEYLRHIQVAIPLFKLNSLFALKVVTRKNYITLNQSFSMRRSPYDL